MMGTRGLGSIQGLLLGSVAMKVVHLAEVPITLFKIVGGSRLQPVASSAAMQRYVRSWNTSRHGADIVSVPPQPSSRLV